MNERLVMYDRMTIPPTRNPVECPICNTWIEFRGVIATLEGDGFHGRYAHADCGRTWKDDRA